MDQTNFEQIKINKSLLGEKNKLLKENMEDLKAQLAINTFSNMIDVSTLEIKESLNENIKEIAQAIESSGGFNLDAWLNEDFSITLDNYSALVGNAWGMDINNFNDLTNWANEIYSVNMTPEQYQKSFETGTLETGSSIADVVKGVDLISELGSFDAASIAAELGTDLQTVADSIAEAAAAGISTDLEAAAQGAGYASFADAVAAYNAQYGTSYTEESAKEALGQ